MSEVFTPEVNAAIAATAVPESPTETAITVPEEPPANLSTMRFFTANPQELCAAQGKLAAWVGMKIAELENELVGLQTEHDIATKNKWRAGPWKRQIALLSKRIDYYVKMRAAFEAGYVMVPVMPMELFAIRTTKSAPSHVERRYQHQAMNLGGGNAALGEGENVSSIAVIYEREYDKKRSDGTTYKESHYHAGEYQAMEFPLEVAKPIIMEKTAHALALKVFDEVGVVKDRQSGRRGDPFVVARIRDPRPNKLGVCFFIGWYINPNNL